MKKLICDKCKTEVGEIVKGRIKRDAILLCGKCALKPRPTEKSDIPSFLFDIINGKLHNRINYK